MKFFNLKIFVFALASILFITACQQTAPVNSNSAMNHNATDHNSMNHSLMNHNAMNSENMNHDAMIHGDHAQMKSAPKAANAPYDLQFLDTMIAHHQGAVDMAKPVEGNAEHGELKTLAKSIITDQEKEIAQMKDWREKWFAGKPSAMNMEMAGMRDSMKGMDMTKLNSLKGKEFDVAFIEMMIPHHKGAVVMAKEALQKAEHAEIKTLAQNIIKAQEAEIKLMQGWKANWTK